MNKRPDYEIAREELSAILVQERIDIRAKFVPFSQSRLLGNRFANARSFWRQIIV